MERHRLEELQNLHHCSSNLHHLTEIMRLNISDRVLDKALVNSLQA